MSVLLDSVILIDHLNGILPAREYIESLNQPRISVITRAEVLSGTGPADAKRVKYLLDQFPALEINQTVADLAADLRRTHRWRLPDAFQAALAQFHGLQLATRNTKDFPPAKFAWVVVPYRT